MNVQQMNRVSSKVTLVLSATALITVLSGYFQSPQADEGSAAHIFQIAIVALVSSILLFLTTADWKKPWLSVRSLVLPVAALLIAFGALYYLEHYR